MKQIIFLLLITTTTYAQDYYGVYQGKKIPYNLSSNKILVKVKNNVGSADGVLLNLRNLKSMVENGGKENFRILEFMNLSKDDISKQINQLNSSELIEYASPFIEYLDGREFAAISNSFIIGLKDKNDIQLLNSFANEMGFKVERQYEFDEKVYFLSVDKLSKLNSIEAALKASNSSLFRYAEPDYLLTNPYGTIDPAFSSQWALNSMSVANAWGITTGCSNIRIAVIDNGVDLTHPDLQANLLPGFDATGSGTNGGSSGTQWYDAHGTNCAGIIGAVANNGIGVAGIAYGAKIVPVKAGSGTFLPYSNAAAAVDWVRINNAADIINYSSSSANSSSQIFTDAIIAATTLGRNGLGIPFITITGNGSTNAIDYPASLNNVIAVGSIDSNGNRASSSNYGSGIDIVAPGVCIYTTDLQNGGQTSSNYWTCFSGTSAAAPNVAGVMALILSVNPTLTFAQARFILESTTDKLSGYTFSSGVGGQPNGTWNNEVGYGKVNANRAIMAAAGAPINGPDLICSTGNFSLQSSPVNLSISWASSNSSILSINPANGSSTMVSTNGGSVTISANLSGSPCPVSVAKTIWVGKPLISNQKLDGNSYYSPTYICPGSHWLTVTPLGTTTYANWTVQQNVPNVVTPNYLDFYMYSNVSSIAITTNASNLCGTGPNASFYLMKKTWGCPSSFAVAASPNPVTDELTVTTISTTDISNDQILFGTDLQEIPPKVGRTVLIDGQGQSIIEGQWVDGKLKLNVKGLKKGLYFLHTYFDDKVNKEQIIVE